MVALKEGRQVNAHMLKSDFESHLFVANARVTTYAKCGSIKDAHLVFDDMLEQDVASWTAIIGGYTYNGYGKEALQLFEEML